MSILSVASRTVVEDAGLIADCLIVPGDIKDQHWDTTAKALIEGLVLHVCSDYRWQASSAPWLRSPIC